MLMLKGVRHDAAFKIAKVVDGVGLVGIPSNKRPRMDDLGSVDNLKGMSLFIEDLQQVLGFDGRAIELGTECSGVTGLQLLLLRQLNHSVME